MTDLPILFSAPMVRGLIRETEQPGIGKTQTRRLLTRNNASVLGHSWRGKSCPWEGLRFAEAVVRTKSPMSGCPDPHLAVPFCHPADEPTASEDCGIYAVRPFVDIGDRLYVREAWRCNGWATDLATIMYRANEGGGYTAMTEQYPVAGRKPLRVTSGWRPGIHMPRWASRLTLTVTDVRVQRLQAISAEDARDEGVDRRSSSVRQMWLFGASKEEREAIYLRACVWEYEQLWGAINGAGSWDRNPWVVAYSFTVDKRNIDQVPA